MNKITAHYISSIITILWFVLFLTSETKTVITGIMVGVFFGAVGTQLLFLTVGEKSLHAIAVTIVPILIFLWMLI